MKPGDLVRLKYPGLRKTNLDQIGIVVEAKKGHAPKVLFPSESIITTVIGNCLEVLAEDVESR